MSDVRRRVPFPRGTPPLADVSTHLVARGRLCVWESSAARPGLSLDVDGARVELKERGSLRLDDNSLVKMYRSEAELLLEGPPSSLSSLDELLRRLGGTL